MKKQIIFRAVVLLIALFAVLFSKPGTSKADAVGNTRYTTSTFPTICNPNGTLPGNCTTTNTGITCTVNGNTYYMGATCVQTYYRQP